MPLPQRLIAKPVARRDKPRKQQVSHEDTLLPKKRSAIRFQPPPKAQASRFLGYSLFTLSKINALELAPNGNAVFFSRSDGRRATTARGAVARWWR